MTWRKTHPRPPWSPPGTAPGLPPASCPGSPWSPPGWRPSCVRARFRPGPPRPSCRSGRPRGVGLVGILGGGFGPALSLHSPRRHDRGTLVKRTAAHIGRPGAGPGSCASQVWHRGCFSSRRSRCSLQWTPRRTRPACAGEWLRQAFREPVRRVCRRALERSGGRFWLLHRERLGIRLDDAETDRCVHPTCGAGTSAVSQATIPNVLALCVRVGTWHQHAHRRTHGKLAQPPRFQGRGHEGRRLSVRAPEERLAASAQE